MRRLGWTTWSWYLDEPVAELSAVGFLALSRLATQHVTVALSGQGADELFGGYRKHRVAAVLRAARRAARRRPPAHRPAAQARPRSAEASLPRFVDQRSRRTPARDEWPRRRKTRATLYAGELAGVDASTAPSHGLSTVRRAMRS